MSKHKFIQGMSPFEIQPKNNFRFSNHAFSVFILRWSFFFFTQMSCQSFVMPDRKNVDAYFCASLSISLYLCVCFSTFASSFFFLRKNKEKKEVNFFGDRSFGRAQKFQITHNRCSFYTCFFHEVHRKKNGFILMSETVMTESHMNDLYQMFTSLFNVSLILYTMRRSSNHLIMNIVCY